MLYIIVIIDALFAMPANALDGTSSPANVAPPIWVGPTLNMPDSEYWHNPNLLEEFQRLAQATPGGSGVDPLIGTWKANLEKSTWAGSLTAPKSQGYTFTGEGQTFTNTIEGVDAQGQPFKIIVRHIYDGMPHPSTGTPLFDSSTYVRIGNTINSVRHKAGKIVNIGQMVIVPGKSITNTEEGIDQNNQPYHVVVVYDRQ
jgi:hypothetical protein